MIRQLRFYGSIVTLALLVHLPVSANLITDPDRKPLRLPSAFVAADNPVPLGKVGQVVTDSSSGAVDFLLADAALPAPDPDVQVVRSRTISEPVTLFLMGLGLLGIGLGARRGNRD